MKRDLQRDRPPPLKIHKQGDNHHRQQQHVQHQPQQAFRQANQYRQPVIIHTYSPEIIQTDSNNFRQLVQRLTGPADQGSPYAPPPPKRARVGLPPTTGNSNLNHSISDSSNSNLSQQLPPLPLAMLSPRGMLPKQGVINPSNYGNLPSNPLLSPTMFDFSPSVLPSPSTFTFDYPFSPMGLPSPLAPGGSTPLSLPAALPSPGPLSAGFLADLPVLSPAAYRWIEKNAASADAIMSSRPLLSSGLPPRPPPLTTTSNLFPLSDEDQKPSLYHEK